MANQNTIIQNVRSLLGIMYDVKEEADIIPIMPDGSDVAQGGLGKLVSELQPHLRTKKEIHEKYTNLKKNHLVEGLLSKVSTDILTKGKPKDDPLIATIKYPPNRKLEKTMRQVLDNFKIETHLKETVFDFLLYGEYYFHIDYKENELDDRYDYVDLLPVYIRGGVDKIVHVRNENLGIEGAKEVKPHTVFFYSLDVPGQRIRLRLKDKSGAKYYVKVPTPFILPSVIRLLNSITLLELLIPLSQLMKVDKGQLVTVGVPPGTQIDQMFKIVREYEKQLNNRFTALSNLSFDSVEDIVQGFGKYKCIPTIGGEKGSMDVRDLPKPQEIEFTDFEYLVSAIANRLNVPISYIISTEEEDPKQKMAYLAKLQIIRDNIAFGVKRFLIDYFAHRKADKKGKIIIDPDKLEVHLHEVPGTESIDTVDYADALSGTLSNVQRIIEDFSRMIGEADASTGLDKDALIKVLNVRLAPILGGVNVFKKPKEPPEEPEEPEGDET